jgi:hypothetical protein
VEFEFRPLGDWTGPSTPPRERTSPKFKARYDATLDLLFAEAEKLGAKRMVLQVDLQERDIRVDGLPRSNARFGSHPGVVISFESRFGPLRYATDQFTEWKGNLRAIALALQALRAVDRYGVTKRGEQYAGWKALPQNASTFASADEAAAWMNEYSRDMDIVRPAGSYSALYRAMARKMHPDTGQPVADWHRLDEARRLLEAEGLMRNG